MKQTLYKLMIAVTALTGLSVSANAQNISTIAGTGGSAGSGGDGSPATAATLNSPGASAFDAAGNLYIADKQNHRIRKVNTAGIISAIVGNGMPGLAGDGGAATAAQLSNPLSVAVDAAGNLYVADFGNSRIRKIDVSGNITTVAGTTAGYTGDGAAATAAKLRSPTDVAVDGAGNIYICDYGNHCIRKVNTSGVITTIAGTGSAGYSGDGAAATAALLSSPNGVCVGRDGSVYIADLGNACVRKINTSGIISTIAGSSAASGLYSGDGGPATAAGMSSPVFVAVDAAGNVFVNDNYWACTRRIAVSGNINTVAGGHGGGYSGDGGAATAAQLEHPTGVTFDAANNMYITEQGNHTVRKVNAFPIIIGGATSVCTGRTTTLSSAVTDDGIWVSSNTAVATVNELTGVVTGVAVGTVTISFSMGLALGTKIMTVNASPNPGAITGAATVCVGSMITLSNSGDAGGTWSSLAPAIATVTSGGVVSGVSGGNVYIQYGVNSVSCGSGSNSQLITVNGIPDAGTISGTNNVCVSSTVTLSNAAAGGVWSSSNTALATVSAGGVVSGVGAGTLSITYTVANSCGPTATTAFPFTVNTCPTGVGLQSAGGAFAVYPNPAAGGSFTIELPSTVVLPAHAVIMNSVGQKIKTIEMNNNRMPVDMHVPAGLYLLSVTADNGTYQAKIAIE